MHTAYHHYSIKSKWSYLAGGLLRQVHQFYNIHDLQYLLHQSINTYTSSTHTHTHTHTHAHTRAHTHTHTLVSWPGPCPPQCVLVHIVRIVLSKIGIWSCDHHTHLHCAAHTITGSGTHILHTFAESTQCGPALPWQPVPSWTCPWQALWPNEGPPQMTLPVNKTYTLSTSFNTTSIRHDPV